jgi:hypothetical protein
MADRAFTDVDHAQEASQQLWRVPRKSPYRGAGAQQLTWP